MLCELRPQSVAHDIVLHSVPILSDRVLPASTHPRGDHGRFCLPNGLLVIRPCELLRLKEVLRRWPNSLAKLDGKGSKVRELAVRLGYTVKLNCVHAVCSALYSAMTSIRPIMFSFGSGRSSVGTHSVSVFSTLPVFVVYYGHYVKPTLLAVSWIHDWEALRWNLNGTVDEKCAADGTVRATVSLPRFSRWLGVSQRRCSRFVWGRR